MIAIVAVPLIIAVLVSYITSTNKALEDVQDSMEWEAWYIEDIFTNVLDTNMNAIKTIAVNPTVINYATGVGDIPYDAVQQTLAGVDEVMGDGENTSVTDITGMQIARGTGDFVSVADREYFQKAVQGTDYVSNIIVSKTDGRRMITFATPIKDYDGNIIGIVHRNYDLDNIRTTLAAESEHAFVVDRNGQIAAHSQYEIATGAMQQADEIQQATENVGYIGEAVEKVKDSSETLTDLAGKMKSASEASGKSLKSLQASSEEMTVKIDEISHTIEATENAVNSISEKVEGITSIATQTNLLSLNASIEAARAGEAGRGFAVVAEEIGKLADDSKQMAEEIKVEMEKLLTQSKAAVSAADAVKKGNDEQQVALGETLKSVTGMLGDINSTVQGVDTISHGAEICDSSKNALVDTMSALSAISEENAASSQETGASMEELSATVTTLAGSASDLKNIAEKLNEDMKFFKG